MFLTQQYMGLSPFEIMKRDYREVLDIYVHTIIHLFGKQNKKQSYKPYKILVPHIILTAFAHKLTLLYNIFDKSGQIPLHPFHFDNNH